MRLRQRQGRCVFGVSLGLLVAGCGSQAVEPYTLYRNSPLDHSHRDHFASFDTGNHNDYNRGNCEMTARLLNANVIAAAKKEGAEPPPGVGFWCEPGAYAEKGNVPSGFNASFPTGSDSEFHW